MNSVKKNAQFLSKASIFCRMWEKVVLFGYSFKQMKGIITFSSLKYYAILVVGLYVLSQCIVLVTILNNIANFQCFWIFKIWEHFCKNVGNFQDNVYLEDFF